jgi:hypothetical protein
MLPELGADAVIQLGQPTDAVTAAFNAEGGEHGYDLVVDYLWGRPAEIFLGAIDRGDAHLGPTAADCGQARAAGARPPRARPGSPWRPCDTRTSGMVKARPAVTAGERGGASPASPAAVSLPRLSVQPADRRAHSHYAGHLTPAITRHSPLSRYPTHVMHAA